MSTAFQQAGFKNARRTWDVQEQQPKIATAYSVQADNKLYGVLNALLCRPRHKLHKLQATAKPAPYKSDTLVVGQASNCHNTASDGEQLVLRVGRGAGVPAQPRASASNLQLHVTQRE